MTVAAKPMPQGSSPGDVHSARRSDRLPEDGNGECIAVVDPIHSGTPFLDAVDSLGFRPVPVYTLPPERLAAFKSAPWRCDQTDIPIQAESATAALAELTERSLSPSAVIAATEPGVQLADELAGALALPHNSLRSAAARRDKIAMRKLGEVQGIAQPRFRVASGEASLATTVADIGLPAIVKAPTGAGSHNVFLVSSMQDLGRIQTAPAVDLFGTPVARWLVEEYVRGDEYAINTFSFAGRHTLLDVWRKRLPTPHDYDQPYWNAHQIGLDDPVRDALERFANRTLDAFEIELGPCHIEVKLAAEGPVLLELGARLPGAHIAEAWRRIGGRDLFNATIRARLGHDPGIVGGLGLDRYLGAVFVSNDGPPARLRRIAGLAEARRECVIEDVRLHYRVGDVVPTTEDLSSMLLTVIVSADTVPELLRSQERVRRVIKPEVAK